MIGDWWLAIGDCYFSTSTTVTCDWPSYYYTIDELVEFIWFYRHTASGILVWPSSNTQLANVLWARSLQSNSMVSNIHFNLTGNGSTSSGKSILFNILPYTIFIYTIHYIENVVFNRRIIKIARHINLWRFLFWYAYIFRGNFHCSEYSIIIGRTDGTIYFQEIEKIRKKWPINRMRKKTHTHTNIVTYSHIVNAIRCTC